MTDQPTTWTPERALIRYGLRWNGPKDFVPIQMDDGYWTPWHEAYAAQNLAAAEIERQKARADALERDLREIAEGCGVGVPDRAEAKRRIIALKGEVERLRAELAAKQPAEAEAAQQGPSDEEISQAINRVEDLGYTSTASALWLIARRAGVKL